MRLQTNQQAILARSKLECEFYLASATCLNYKLNFALSGLTREEFDFRQSEQKLIEKLRELREKKS